MPLYHQPGAALDAALASLLVPLTAWILLSGVDDLFILCCYLARRWLARRRPPLLPEPSPSDLRAGPLRRIAIFVPLWHEDAVIASMLEHNLAAIEYPCYDFFVGVYPNDPATNRAVSRIEARFPNVHLALCPHVGPTSKADCLNWIYQRMLLFEQETGTRFEVVLTHDAEDIIHPEALLLANYYNRSYGMVQTPVLALATPVAEFTHGLYCDDFAEFHAKDLPVRSLLGGFIPSSGVGTSYSRSALERLAAADNNCIFHPECLTEDYENGLRLHQLGCPQIFIAPHSAPTVAKGIDDRGQSPTNAADPQDAKASVDRPLSPHEERAEKARSAPLAQEDKKRTQFPPQPAVRHFSTLSTPQPRPGPREKRTQFDRAPRSKPDSPTVEGGPLPRKVTLSAAQPRPSPRAKRTQFDRLLHSIQRLLPTTDTPVPPVATREFFPRSFHAALRQRTRWVTGIALQGWQRHGWNGGRWGRYWFWRDRKGLLGNPLSILANLIFLYGACTYLRAAWSGAAWGLGRAAAGTLPAGCLTASAALGLLQIACRTWFSARFYGWRFALAAPLRAPLGNVLNSAATACALWRFAAAGLAHRPHVWLKTEHAYPSLRALLDHKRPLGEILVECGFLTPGALARALAEKPPEDRLGDFLILRGSLTEEQLCTALSLQHGLDTEPIDPHKVPVSLARSLPAQLIQELQVLPVALDQGTLRLAVVEIPSEHLQRQLQRVSRLEFRFTLVTPRHFQSLCHRLL